MMNGLVQLLWFFVVVRLGVWRRIKRIEDLFRRTWSCLVFATWIPRTTTWLIVQSMELYKFLFRSDIARFESPTPIPATLYHVNWIDPQSGPAFLEFRFIYRSREVLTSKGIISGPPVPEVAKAPSEEPQKRGKKRKIKNVANRKKANKKNEQPDLSPTANESIESHLPSESRLTKKFRTTSVETQAKKDNVPPSKEKSPAIAIMDSSNPPTSPLVDIVQRRQSISQPVSTGVLTWVESQSANVDVPIDILRELRELRVRLQ
jgi:hypothetical protein